MSWKITQEDTLLTQHIEQIELFWQQAIQSSTFTGVDNVTLHTAFCIPPDAHTAVVLLNGRVETLLKYKEVIYDLYQNGFACFTLDHRGQGLSDRMVADSQHGFVRDFDHYVQDIMQFVENTVKPNWSGPLQLLCHSMGGAIGALLLLRHPDAFAKAVLCSPMFGVKPALPDWLARSLLCAGHKWNQWRDLESGYFFGQKPYVAYPFKVNPLTHSKVRYEVFVDLYRQQPDLQLGGVTTEWLEQAHHAMNHIEAEAQNITTPTLVLSSRLDLIIDNRRQKRVAAKLPNGTFHSVGHAFHELLMEKDKCRNEAITRAFDFLTGA